MLIHNRLALIPTLMALLATGACLGDSTAPDPPRAWQGTLQPVGADSEITGSVAALARHSTTDAGITILNGTPGAVYTWAIAAGACAEPDELDTVVANAFPATILAGEEGQGSAELAFAGVLDGGVDYAGVVRDSDAEALLACADLAFTSDPGS